jgi:hypothetical protein
LGALIKLVGLLSDPIIQVLVYVQSIMMIMAGALVIANNKYGGLLMSIAMVGLILTRDNPLLAHSEMS